jgi:type 1 glutamine amidotransferase
MPHATVTWGGWEGHEPKRVAEFCAEILTAEGYKVDVHNSLDCFVDSNLAQTDLIIPVWTMAEITPEQAQGVIDAVAEHGVGMAGCHGGMCDSFRSCTEWQFMTGGQWVAHPGDTNVTYSVNMNREIDHEITRGLPDFELKSEQYYLHTDPGNTVLGTTTFPSQGIAGPHSENPCKMPQIWVKKFGKGQIFYFAVGHQRTDLEPETPKEIMRRGMLWATRS